MRVTATIAEKPKINARNTYVGNLRGKQLEVDRLRKVKSEHRFVCRKLCRVDRVCENQLIRVQSNRDIIIWYVTLEAIHLSKYPFIK